MGEDGEHLVLDLELLIKNPSIRLVKELSATNGFSNLRANLYELSRHLRISILSEDPLADIYLALLGIWDYVDVYQVGDEERMNKIRGKLGLPGVNCYENKIVCLREIGADVYIGRDENVAKEAGVDFWYVGDEKELMNLLKALNDFFKVNPYEGLLSFRPKRY